MSTHQNTIKLGVSLPLPDWATEFLQCTSTHGHKLSLNACYVHIE